jgi:hypothetical protein
LGHNPQTHGGGLSRFRTLKNEENAHNPMGITNSQLRLSYNQIAIASQGGTNETNSILVSKKAK